MATKDDLRSELNWITEKISSQVWTLNLGTLGTTWSLLIVSGLPTGLRFTTRNAIWVFIPSLLSLLCEMGQYLCGYFLARRLLNDMEENNTTEFQYPKMAAALFLYENCTHHWRCCCIVGDNLKEINLIIRKLGLWQKSASKRVQRRVLEQIGQARGCGPMRTFVN
jgi:hypothetical protein